MAWNDTGICHQSSSYEKATSASSVGPERCASMRPSPVTNPNHVIVRQPAVTMSPQHGDRQGPREHARQRRRSGPARRHRQRALQRHGRAAPAAPDGGHVRRAAGSRIRTQGRIGPGSRCQRAFSHRAPVYWDCRISAVSRDATHGWLHTAQQTAVDMIQTCSVPAHDSLPRSS